jgi:hypothetical protein
MRREVTLFGPPTLAPCTPDAGIGGVLALVMRRVPAVDQVMTMNLDPLRAAAAVRGIKPPDL